MRIVEINEPEPLLNDVYLDVLQPSFPPDELMDADAFTAAVAAGHLTVSAVLDGERKPVAAAVGLWAAESRVQMLLYLAVLPSQRGTGVGGQLLGHVLAAWRDRYVPCLIVAEVEHPGAHSGSEAHGDPAARLRFYARYGGVALDLPFFQPALAPGGNRFYGMILTALHIDPGMAGSEPGTVAAEPLRTFLTGYLAGTEGSREDSDPAAKALFAALDRPGGVPTLPLDDPSRLPISTPG